MENINVLLFEDSKEPKFVSFDRNDYKKLYELLKCDTYECIERKIGDKYYDLWVDGEFLLKNRKEWRPQAVCKNANEILFGSIIVANRDGEEMGSLTPEDVATIMTNLSTPIAEVGFAYTTPINDIWIVNSPKDVILTYEA